MANEILIGELVDAAGVGVETVRFHERKGLLQEPPRINAGYWLYDRDAVRRLRFIRRAKDLGFTLSETKELLELQVTDASACDDVAERARRKIEIVEDRVRDLNRIRSVLEVLVAACTARVATAECPILEVLDDHAPDERGDVR